MDPELIPALEEALKVSPANGPLRRQLGNLLMGCGRLEDAEDVLRDKAGGEPSPGLQAALARCFAMQGKASQAIAVAESLIPRDDVTTDVLLSVCHTLKTLGEEDAARSAYRRAVELDPEVADPALAESVGAESASWAEADEPGEAADGDDDDDVDDEGRMRMRIENAPEGFAGLEVEKPDVTFDDVGGMDALKEQIRLKIIAPLENAELYAAYGKAIGGGILMYGPPGCGKTHLARATAGQIDSAFINVGIHDVLDMYVGEGEKKLHALFEYARAHTPCVLFFDEVDGLGGKR